MEKYFTTKTTKVLRKGHKPPALKGDEKKRKENTASSFFLGKDSLEPKKAVEPRWQTCPPKAMRAGIEPMELETEEGGVRLLRG